MVAGISESDLGFGIFLRAPKFFLKQCEKLVNQPVEKIHLKQMHLFGQKRLTSSKMEKILAKKWGQMGIQHLWHSFLCLS
jgi:hypothetical protein